MINLLPKDQIKSVFSQDMCDIEPDFLGFTDIYENLSKIIPKHFTIIDLGCGYNPQCFYFKEHKKYISVDIGKLIRFKSDNCEIYVMTIKEFIDKYLWDFDLDETFAICSYVPSCEVKLVRENFKNVFTYYPSNKKANVISKYNEVV